MSAKALAVVIAALRLVSSVETAASPSYYTLGESPPQTPPEEEEDFDPSYSVSNVASHSLCAAFAKAKAWNFFRLENESSEDGLCHLGHTRGSASPTVAASNIRTSISPDALAVVGPDGELSLLLSDGSQCGPQEHGVPALPSAEAANGEMGVASAGWFFYACGGKNVDTCRKWDTRTEGGWQAMSPVPLNEARCTDGGMVASGDGGGGRIFFVPKLKSPNAFQYSEEEDAWSYAGAFQRERSDSSVVMHGGVLLVLGGRDGTGLDSIESWDSEAVPQPPQFQTHPHTLAKRALDMACSGGVTLPAASAAGASETGILCAGGVAAGRKLEDVQFIPLDPAPAPARLLGAMGGEARRMAPLAVPRMSRMLFFGGEDDDGDLDRVLELDYSTGAQEDGSFRVLDNVTMSVTPRSIGIVEAKRFRRCFL